MAIPQIGSNIVNPGTFQVATVVNSKKAKAAATDTVKISDAAKSLQAKTAAPARVVQAASGGDLQAKAQLARPTTAATGKK